MDTQLSELNDLYRTIDETLGQVESCISGTISPDKFSEEIDFELLVDIGRFHISRSKALKVGASWKMHSHPESTEIVILVKGKGVVIWGNNHRELHPPECVTIPPGVAHGGYALEEGTEIISVVMPADENIKKFLYLLKSGVDGGI